MIVLLLKLPTRCLPFHLSASQFHTVRKRDIWAKLQAAKLRKKNIFVVIITQILCNLMSQEIVETKSLAGGLE